jgi:hypothetical protein
VPDPQEPTLSQLTDEILRFRDDRDWAQFHTPRNLAAALAIESAELQETMLWKTDAEVAQMIREAPWDLRRECGVSSPAWGPYFEAHRRRHEEPLR